MSAATTPAEQFAVRGSLARPPSTREQIAAALYDRLHPLMAALGFLFLVLVLAQGPAQEGSTLQQVLLAGTWLLWTLFVAEYLLRLVIAPSSARFLRRTWWQLLFLFVPVLMLFRAVLVLRIARPTRVTLAALRGSRSAGANLTGRMAWLGVITVIVAFSAADLLYTHGGIRPYGDALHAAALASVTGEPTTSATGLGQILDVVLAVYAVVFFATLAGTIGAFFLEHDRMTSAEPTRSISTSATLG